MPWEFVLPIEEMIVPNKITNKTSHRMPSAARLGRKAYERCWVIGNCCVQYQWWDYSNLPEGI